MLHTSALLILALQTGSAVNEGQEPQAPPILDQVIAKAGATEINLRDVRAEVNRIVPLTFFHAKLPEEKKLATYREALDNLIEKALIEQDAAIRGIKVSEQELQAEFRKTLKKAGPQYDDIDQAQFLDLLDNYRPKVTRRVLIDKNEARFEKTLKPVTKEMVQAHYEQNKEHMITTEEARFLHILRKVPPSAGGEEGLAIRQDIEGLLEQIRAGADFVELAKEHSEDIYASHGGDMGFLKSGAFQISELNDAAFLLEDGETSGILISLYGFHILRRVESKPQRQLTLEEAEEGLRLEMDYEMRNSARKAWIEQMTGDLGVEELVLFESVVKYQDH